MRQRAPFVFYEGSEQSSRAGLVGCLVGWLVGSSVAGLVGRWVGRLVAVCKSKQRDEPPATVSIIKCGSWQKTFNWI